MEDKAMKVILEIGAQGILQADLWKHLETNSREGSRLAVRLEKRGLIRRKKELIDGRWTFRLYAASKTAKVEPLNTLEGCPCFTCPDLSRCGNLHSVTPVFCAGLDRWLQKISCNTDGENAYANTPQKEMP